MSGTVLLNSASFRDPAGFVYQRDKQLLRQVNQAGVADYRTFVSSGLSEELTGLGLLVAAKEVDLELRVSEEGRVILAPEEVPTISYPWEWCFSAFKAAAQLTLDVQARALRKNMILKDATPLNVQFVGCKPLFIDTLSFTPYQQGAPWQAYRQFCEEFLAPLLLLKYLGSNAYPLLRGSPRGIPVSIARKLLPFRSWFSPAIVAHVQLHGLAQEKVKRGDNAKIKSATVSKYALEALIDSLHGAVDGAELPDAHSTWNQYYQNTNYSDPAFVHKQELIKQLVTELSPQSVLDLGANVGAFSQIARDSGAKVVAADFDALCVDALWRAGNKRRETNILPLILDVLNPSPAMGVGLTEFSAAPDRLESDVVLALALIHHLAISGGVPLPHLAKLLARYGRHLIVEFVPSEDSQTQDLLTNRGRVFPEYTLENFERAFSVDFELMKKIPIRECQRTLVLFRRR